MFSAALRSIIPVSTISIQILYSSPSQITDQYIEELANKNGWTIKDGKIYNILHNDDGYLYISYEDANVYNGMMGIIKADDKVSYDNIYQYDFYGEVTLQKIHRSRIAELAQLM